MKKTYLAFLFLSLWFASVFGQTTSLNQTIRLWAEEKENKIQLNWPKDTRAGGYTIFRKEHLSKQNWLQIAQLSESADFYLDDSSQKGVLYDYQVRKGQLSVGYAAAGIDFEPSDRNGTALVVVEDEIWQSLKANLIQFGNSLWAEGWKVRFWRVSNQKSVAEIKEQIIHFDSVIDLEAIIIVGRVAVPYSGDWLFDGHSDHHGAWPSDVFYGTFGTWTDVSVNRVSATRPQNRNIPGDGKFDQTNLPEKCRHLIGRIDFHDVSAAGKTQTQLIEGYIARNLAFRRAQTDFEMRGLVDDNFTGLNLAATGWANLSNLFGAENVSSEDYFTTLQEKNYLFSYGCGPGSYTSCGGVGSSADFVSKPLKHSFTLLAGSYFGDWDSQNNLMRTAVATSALACGWGGIPKWYVQHSALGLPLGYGVRLTQNNRDEFFNGNFNSSSNAIHIALMGDPTLRLFPVQMPQNLNVTESGNQITLTWAGQAESYLVYRIDTAAQSILRLTPQPIKSKVFTTNKFVGNHLYCVRAVQPQKTGGGTFVNLSAGAIISTSFTSGLEQEEAIFTVYPNPSKTGFGVKSQMQAQKIEVFDALGRMLYSGLETEHLQLGSGVYWLKIHWVQGGVSACKWLRE